MSADLPAPKKDPHGALASLFAEELGLVLEVKASEAAAIAELYNKAGVPASVIGKVGEWGDIIMQAEGHACMAYHDHAISRLRRIA